MARPLRLEYPGAYYHVINRGNAGENIFLSGLSGKELGEYFGGVSGAAITMSYKQFINKLAKDKSLQRLINRIRKRIFNF